MNTKFDLMLLFKKPIALMNGEELAFLVGSCLCEKLNLKEPVKKKGIFYGIAGIAQVFGCSVPTANRIKRSGIIDDAITQIGRKIIVDADLALQLAKEADAINVNVAIKNEKV